MLLVNQPNWLDWDNDRITDFFEEHNLFIMGAFSDYYAMYPNIQDESLAVLTILYLCYGTDSEIPDPKPSCPYESMEEWSAIPAVNSLYQLILIAQELSVMEREGLVKVEKDIDGNVFIHLTDKGRQRRIKQWFRAMEEEDE
jgi:hypothetical protein